MRFSLNARHEGLTPSAVEGEARPARRGRRALLLAAAGLAVAGHTPFLQWQVYRKRHLLILGSKDDPDGYRLAVAVADALARALPESKARPSRAANASRLASLIGTGQMDVAVVTPTLAQALADGAAPFADAGPVDLRLLLDLGSHLLVARADFPEDHAYLVVEALDHAPMKAVLTDTETPLPLHPGARRYRERRDPL